MDSPSHGRRNRQHIHAALQLQGVGRPHHQNAVQLAGRASRHCQRRQSRGERLEVIISFTA